MNSYPHLLILDLSSYGAAFSIVNHFSDDDQIKVFEISPLGNRAILILSVKDHLVLDIIEKEILAFHKSNILFFSKIKNIKEEVLLCYLSQNKPSISKHMLIQEFSNVSDAFTQAQKHADKQIQLVDFRVVRTQIPNIILTSTIAEIEQIETVSCHLENAKNTLIPNVSSVTKKYFEI